MPDAFVFELQHHHENTRLDFITRGYIASSYCPSAQVFFAGHASTEHTERYKLCKY